MASWQTAPRFPAVSRGAAVDDCLREFSAGRQSVARPALPVHRWHQQSREATMVVKRERCGDCHALEGEYHELGCDLERCPFCGGQLISCDCCYEILNINGSPRTRVYEFGLTPEQRKQWERTLNDKGRVPFIMYPNMCVKCGKLWPEMFSVPDKEWERYVEKGERDKMLCKPCYDQIKIWIDESRGTETA